MDDKPKTLPFKTSKYPGVRFREHPTRKHGVLPDRYFAIRYQVDRRRVEEGLGWASEGWTDKKALVEMEKLKTAAKTGEGPSSLREKRAIADAKRTAEEATAVQAQKDALPFGQFFETTYLPQEQADGKAPGHVRQGGVNSSAFDGLGHAALVEICVSSTSLLWVLSSAMASTCM